MRQGAQGRCTGMTLRDGMGREVGERFRMGNTCTLMADSCQCMAKTTTIQKKKMTQKMETKAESRISSNKVDETGAYYTERNKSERKTPIQYINTYIWNLEKW